MENNEPQQQAEMVIFRWSFRNPKTGKIVTPKNGKPFPIKVKVTT